MQWEQGRERAVWQSYLLWLGSQGMAFQHFLHERFRGFGIFNQEFSVITCSARNAWGIWDFFILFYKGKKKKLSARDVG